MNYNTSDFEFISCLPWIFILLERHTQTPIVVKILLRFWQVLLFPSPIRCNNFYNFMLCYCSGVEITWEICSWQNKTVKTLENAFSRPTKLFTHWKAHFLVPAMNPIQMQFLSTSIWCWREDGFQTIPFSFPASELSRKLSGNVTFENKSLLQLVGEFKDHSVDRRFDASWQKQPPVTTNTVTQLVDDPINFIIHKRVHQQQQQQSIRVWAMTTPTADTYLTSPTFRTHRLWQPEK